MRRLTVDWEAFSGGNYVPRYRYPQPISGYICKRCISRDGRKSHGCADLTCSCDCPELALTLPSGVVPDQEFDGVPFHGRRQHLDEIGFFRAALPVTYGRNSHKMHRIRRTAWDHRRSCTDPYLYRQALRLHDALIKAACTRPQPWLPFEAKAIWDADKELLRERNWREAEADRFANAFNVPLYQRGQKWRVLRMLVSGATTSHDISGMTALPLKSTSAWLSVLERDGYARRIEERRFQTRGPSHIIWEANLGKVLELEQGIR